MKLINQNVEEWRCGYTLPEIWSHIAKCARVCYTPDVEVLTDNGWKRFDALSNNDKVLSYEPTSNKLIYDNPNILINDYDDDLIIVKHKSVDFSVTKDHRIYCASDKYGDRNFSFITAKEMYDLSYNDCNKKTRIPQRFKNTYLERDIKIPTIEHSKVVNGGNHKDYTKSIKLDYNKDFICLLGAFISEGHTYHGEKYGTGSYCQITQTENKELYNITIKALDNLGIKYRINSDPRKKQVKWIKFGDSVLVDYFDKLVGKGSANLHLPVWFRNLPTDDLKLLIKILYLGDGSHNTTRTEHYCSISKRLLDELQELFIILGSSATVGYSESDSRYCYVNELRNDTQLVGKHDMYLKHYKGKVYCTSTKSGIICIRREGRMCWCGNCYQSEPRNNGETDEEFVNRVILRNHSLEEIGESRELQLKLHLSCLEHGTVYLDIPYLANKERLCVFFSNTYSRFKCYKIEDSSDTFNIAITTNMRVIIENGCTDLLNYLCTPTKYHYLRTTFNITTDIGVARELARHRTHSISEESTRYCNYSKDKFNNELTFIKPCLLNDEKLKLYGDYHTVIRDKSPESIFIANLNNVEKDYLDLIKLGWTPQQARQILPLSTKVQTIHTAFESDWAEFISLRADACSGSVHPNMKVIANKIMCLMAKKDDKL